MEGMSGWRGRAGPVALYAAVSLVGAAAFLWPFLLPGTAAPSAAHAADAPLLTAVVAGLAVATVALEVRSRSMNGATIALLGVLAASTGLLRFLDLPGGGSGMFFLAVLAGAAFGARFGVLLGLVGMGTSAFLTGGVGPWLPFQMLALAWMAGGAGLVGSWTRRWPPRLEVAALAVYGWGWGFLYGAVMNLWFWPFVQDGGALSYLPGAGAAETLRRYAAFYAATSFAWDAAGAFANAVLITVTGRRVLAVLRRYAARLDPVVELVEPVASAGSSRPAATGRGVEHGEDGAERAEPYERPAVT